MHAAEILSLRSKIGLSQEAFAKALRVSLSTVNRWELRKQAPSLLQEQQMVALKGLLQREDIDQDLLRDIILLTGVEGGIIAAAIKGIQLDGPLGLALNALTTSSAVDRLVLA